MVAATALDSGGISYEEFVRLHAEEFQRYLHTVLGHEVEGRGGRVAVEDTLQEALLRIHSEWPELRLAADPERDRRLYRCLRDAAGEALRSEHGRRDNRGERPRIVTFDFGALRDSSDAQPVAERELTAAVLGTMARDLATDQPDSDARAMLNRAVLLAGLRALSEREAVIPHHPDQLAALEEAIDRNTERRPITETLEALADHDRNIINYLRQRRETGRSRTVAGGHGERTIGRPQ